LPAGSLERRALIVAGNDHAARQAVTEFIDTIGFDIVDLGELAEGWRIQRDTPGYVARRTAPQLREDVATARRYRDMTELHGKSRHS
ncbi:MAG: NADP oxidoreductase, partial [Nocardioides sp.]|nr:NADP oxidoreductase [Nocardioides sp.]